MTNLCARRGLQHYPAINRGKAFDIFRQAQGAGKIKARRRIEAEDQAIARYLRPIRHGFGPIHHHPAIGGVAADPKTDGGRLLRNRRNAQGEP